MIAKAQAQPDSRMQMRLASVLPLKTDYIGLVYCNPMCE